MHEENQIKKPAVSLEKSELSHDDLSNLFNYPSIGELFSENNSDRLDEFCQRLTSTRESLERIIRYGKRDEAERATRAVRALEVTLEFLQNLQKMRPTEKK